MCGIAGFLRFDRSARAEPALLEAMAGALAHRGPDDEGFYVDGNVGLAHRRLSIIDLAGGHQPLFNEDRSASVVFNGEIYNYRELTAELEAEGHVFATRSDTEAIVHAYDQHGTACVDHLRGIFAFAIWDRRRRRLLLARDRLGVKPLYYFLGPGLLAFASEIKALLEHPEVPREVDREALELYLALRYVPGPRTLFRGIRKLQPGHVLAWDESGLRVRQYWDVPKPGEAPAAPADSAEPRHRFAALFEESVRIRRMSEVPLGVFLSGGLDSTAVLAMLHKIEPERRIRTFTVGYQGDGPEERRADELGYARLAAESFGAEHTEVRLSDDDFRDVLPELAWHLDEPVADPACVPLYFISRRASEDITVVLSGEGADEILAGYGAYQRMLALGRIHRLAGPLAGLAAGAAGRFPAGGRTAERVRHALHLASLPLERRYRGVSRGFLPETWARLLGHGDGAERRQRLLDGVFDPLYEATSGAPALDRMLYVDLKTWLPDDLLVKADKMTMAHGQELRVPFLDHRLVELAASLPPEVKLRRGRGKALLRDAVSGLVPRAIIDRPKKGFPVPTVPLLRRLGDHVRDVLLDRDSACRSWFDAAEVERLLDEHRRGGAHRDQEIWSLLVFETWHGVFLDRRFAPARRRDQRLAAAGA